MDAGKRLDTSNLGSGKIIGKQESGIQWRWLSLALGSLGALLLLTHIPQERVPIDLNWLRVDKAIHTMAYGGLTSLFLLAFGMPRRPLALLAIVAFMLVVAALDEWTQGFVGRNASQADFCADGVGAVLAVALLLAFDGRKKRVARL